MSSFQKDSGQYVRFVRSVVTGTSEQTEQAGEKMVEDLDERSKVCICGHPKSKHRKSGRCWRCGCKEYSEQAHHSDCRCSVCLWNRIQRLEKEALASRAYINDELRPLLNKHEDFLDRMFKITNGDLKDLQNIRERENKKLSTPSVPSKQSVEKPLAGMTKQQVKAKFPEPKPVQPKPSTPTNQG